MTAVLRTSWLVRLVVCVLAVLAAGTRAHAAEPLHVWHAYRGAEEKALVALAERSRAAGHPVELLSVPFGAYASKLESGIKLGHGPDVFLDAHERLGSYLAQNLLGRIPVPLADTLLKGVAKEDVDVVSAPDGAVYGIPIAHKTVALYVNDALLPRAPATFEELLAARTSGAPYGIVYESGSAYFHAGLLHAFGGRFLRRAGDEGQPFVGQYGPTDDTFGFVGTAAARSVDFVQA
ncbi:extracellular solute-binding protein, partial [bacterium]